VSPCPASDETVDFFPTPYFIEKLLDLKTAFEARPGISENSMADVCRYVCRKNMNDYFMSPLKVLFLTAQANLTAK